MKGKCETIEACLLKPRVLKSLELKGTPGGLISLLHTLSRTVSFWLTVSTEELRFRVRLLVIKRLTCRVYEVECGLCS